MDFSRRQIRVLLGIVAFGVALFVGLWHLGSVLGVLRAALDMASFLLIGLSLAFILNTPMRFIEIRLLAPLGRAKGFLRRARRPLALALTLVLAVCIVLLAVFMVIPEMGRTLRMLAAEIPGFMEQAAIWLEDTAARHNITLDSLASLPDIDWADLGQKTLDVLRRGMGNLLTGTVNAASSAVSTGFNLLMGLILSFYVLLRKEALARQARRALYAFLPAQRVERGLYIAGKANQTFSSFISGQLLEAVILGVLCFIGMSIFGFRFAPMVSVLVGVTAVIPMFGAFIGCAVGAFMILVNQGLVTAAWFILFFVILQQIEGNLIYPHVVGKSVMLPGLWVLIAVTLGGNIAGIMGMLISVPLCSVLYALGREAVQKRLADRDIT